MPPSNFSGSPLRGFRRISYTNGGVIMPGVPSGDRGN